MKSDVPGMLRRTFLAGLPAAMAAGLGARASAAPMAPEGPAREDGMATLQQYCGVYRVADDHDIGVDRFINDAGDAVLLFADYRTGVVRQLFAQSDGAFTMGPGFAEPAPVELTIRFATTAGGDVEGMTLHPAEGPPVSARRDLTRDEEVSFTQADATLAGTLVLPEGPGPHPAIVLLHGSGPLTRFSFGPYPRFFNSLGLAVLHFDKRGTGASTGRRLDASTGRPETLWPAYYPDDLREDALAAFRFLQGRPDIDAARIGFWGSSEGGMLTTQAAAYSSQVAFIINSVGFMGPLWRTILYQGAAKLRQAGATEEEIAQAVAFNRSWMEVGWTGDGFDAFVAQREEVVRDGKTGWLFYEGAAFTSAQQIQWLMEHIMNFDPLPHLARVRCPALGIFGADDLLTDAENAARMMREALTAAGAPDATVTIIPNAGHSLMETPAGARMAPGVFDTLRTWLDARV